MLETLYETHVKDCQKCHLAQARTNTVFGQGDADARAGFARRAADTVLAAAKRVKDAGTVVYTIGLGKPDDIMEWVLRAAANGKPVPVLDAPSMGLTPLLVESIFNTIQEINRGNLTAKVQAGVVLAAFPSSLLGVLLAGGLLNFIKTSG